MKEVIKYIASVCMVLGYVIVLLISFDTSNLSEEYHMYYLDNQLKHYCEDNELREKYGVNNQFNYYIDGTYRNQGIGWSHIESHATWTIGNKSEFFVYVNDESEDICLSISIIANMGYENYLLVNDVFLCEIEEEQNLWSVTIPASLLDKGINKFTIATDDEVIPFYQINEESTDERCLNLMVESIGIYAKQ